jgi:hypothetical protein
VGAGWARIGAGERRGSGTAKPASGIRSRDYAFCPLRPWGFHWPSTGLPLAFHWPTPSQGPAPRAFPPSRIIIAPGPSPALPPLSESHESQPTSPSPRVPAHESQPTRVHGNVEGKGRAGDYEESAEREATIFISWTRGSFALPILLSRRAGGLIDAVDFASFVATGQLPFAQAPSK